MSNMSFNYRLFKQDTPNAVEGDHLYFVAECYYEKGKPIEHGTMEHNHVNGNSIQETIDTYTLMNEAFDAPVINLDADGKFKVTGAM